MDVSLKALANGFGHLTSHQAALLRNVIIALYVCINICLVVCILAGFLLNVMGYECGPYLQVNCVQQTNSLICNSRSQLPSSPRGVSCKGKVAPSWEIKGLLEAGKLRVALLCNFFLCPEHVFLIFLILFAGLVWQKRLGPPSSLVSVLIIACTWHMPTTGHPVPPRSRRCGMPLWS